MTQRGKFNEVKKRKQLFHQISTLSPNSYGLQLEVTGDQVLLHQNYVDGLVQNRDVSWEFSKLKNRLREKHRETFWVTAQTQGRSGQVDERYWYSKIKHTSNVDELAFPTLVELGVITLDYTIKEKPNGGTKDQGYLFKMSSKNLDLLFTSVKEYNLVY